MTALDAAFRKFWHTWFALNPTTQQHEEASRLVNSLERDLSEEDLVLGLKFITRRLADLP